MTEVAEVSEEIERTGDEILWSAVYRLRDLMHKEDKYDFQVHVAQQILVKLAELISKEAALKQYIIRKGMDND